MSCTQMMFYTTNIPHPFLKGQFLSGWCWFDGTEEQARLDCDILGVTFKRLARVN